MRIFASPQAHADLLPVSVQALPLLDGSGGGRTYVFQIGVTNPVQEALCVLATVAVRTKVMRAMCSPLPRLLDVCFDSFGKWQTKSVNFVRPIHSGSEAQW